MIKTPALDEISLKDWFDTTYNLQQEQEIDSLLTNHIWVTAFKLKIPVSEMTTSHIQNCIRCWEGKGRAQIPSNYLGGKTKWLKIFTNELIKRQ